MKEQVEIKENINISENLKVKIIRAVENAQNQLKDEDSLRIMNKIETEKLSASDIEDKKRLEILIDQGMVNRLLNNEVVVSGIGFQALKNMENKK